MKLSEELTWRGFVGQTTYEDLSVLDTGLIKFYWGVDPSSDSMTIGNLAAAILALHFVRAGHEAVLLAGGATGMAGGDPDGKDETRTKIDLEVLKQNILGIEAQFKNIFHNEKFELVNNYDWFSEVGYIDFLREVGWNFSMTQLLDRDFVQSRIGEGGKGLNYAEFSYSLIQGYDFLHLYRTRGVTLQLCAVDQFGNSISGMQMIRKLENARADVFGMPLIVNKSTGRKFGKSEDGAVWLSATKTSPYQFYQFWLNVDDAGVVDYLKIYTFLSKDEIDALANAQAADLAARPAQRKLAHEVTNLVHGREITKSVERVNDVLFGDTSFSKLSDTDLDNLACEVPTVAVGSTIVSALVESEISSSNSDAIRLIKQNAISLNGEKIAADQVVSEPALVKKGKNSFVLVR
jgi:tyrosyl-tRNA synthetase